MDGILENNGEVQKLNQPQPHPKKMKYLTTVAILFGNITFGSAFSFFSPALEDLRSKYHTDIDAISVVFTIMLVAYCIGALSCGIIGGYMNRQLIAIICLTGMGVALLATPHCDTKTQYFIAGGILGFFAGIYDATQVVWIIEVWQEKAGPFIQAQHFCYAVGANLAPLLLGPFLMKDTIKDESATNSTISTTELPYDERGSKIVIPFSIAGGLCALAGAFQILLFIFYRYYEPPMYATAEENNESKQVEGEKNEKKSLWEFVTSPRMKIIVITGVFIGTDQGMEICTAQFIPIFGQYSNLRMSESDSAFVLTGLTGAFAVGRLIGIFVSLKVSPMLLLVCSILLVLAGNFMLLFWADNNLTMFWIACITIGFGFSTLIASFSGFMEKHLIFTNAIGSFMIVCGSSIAAVYPIIVGKGIEDNPTILSYPIFFSLGCMSIALGIGWWMTRVKHERY